MPTFRKIVPILIVLIAIFFAFSASAAIVPNCEGASCDFGDLVTLGKNVIDFLLIDIASPVAGVLFAYAGFIYVTSGGNPGKTEKAKGIFFNVFIGYAIALAAWLIVNLLTTFFLKDSPSPNELLSATGTAKIFYETA